MKFILNGKIKKRSAAAVWLCLLFPIAVFAGGCGSDPTEAKQPDYVTGEEVPSEEWEASPDDLVIPMSELTEDVSFYGTVVDGTYVEVIAFVNGSSYRTAFNTCQVCYGSPNAYFVQSGNYLQCQNCRAKFKLSNVGIEVSSRYCSPYPILTRTLTEDSVVIPYQYLLECKALFETWKTV